MIKMINKMYNVFQRIFWSKLNNNLAERYPQYQIGKGTYGDIEVSSWGEGATLTIGSFTSIASGVKVFLGGEHRIDWITTFPFNVLWPSANQYTGHPKTKGNVVIGNDVWIGTEALILSGVKIGDGAVIGARSVIAFDVPPYAVVVGNPAKIIKYRFNPHQIERLLVLKWWSMSELKINMAMPYLLNNDIQAFLDIAESGAFDE